MMDEQENMIYLYTLKDRVLTLFLFVCLTFDIRRAKTITSGGYGHFVAQWFYSTNSEAVSIT